jgi:hypothetical protein
LREWEHENRNTGTGTDLFLVGMGKGNGNREKLFPQDTNYQSYILEGLRKCNVKNTLSRVDELKWYMKGIMQIINAKKYMKSLMKLIKPFEGHIILHFFPRL